MSIALVSVGQVRMELGNPQRAESPLKEALELSRKYFSQSLLFRHYDGA